MRTLIVLLFTLGLASCSGNPELDACMKNLDENLAGCRGTPREEYCLKMYTQETKRCEERYGG